MDLVTSRSKTIRLLVIFVAATAILSLLYGIQYYAGSPLRLHVTSEIYDLALSPNGQYLAAGTQDGDIRLWTLSSNWTRHTLSGHQGPVTGVLFADERTLVSVGHDGTIRRWDVLNRQIESTLDPKVGPLSGADLSADSLILATIGEDGLVRIWDLTTGQQIQSIGPNNENALALSYDGSLVATGDDTKVQIWDARSGKAVQQLVGYWEDETPDADWIGHETEVTALAFSPDGDYVVSGSAKGTVLIWQLDTGMVQIPKGHLAAVLDIEFDDSGEYLLSGGRDNMLRRWLAPSGKFGGIFTGHLGTVSSVAFGPNGDTVFSGGTDGSVRQWDVASNLELYLARTQLGLMPIWGTVLAAWMLGSGLLGLLLLWGLLRMRTWGYLGALLLYMVGPLFAVVLPLFETTVYAMTWTMRLSIAWPLLLLLAWYLFLVVYLRREDVAISYQAPDATSLAEQLMASRRSKKTRRSFSVLTTWLFIFILLYSMLRRFGLDAAFQRKWLPFIMEGAGLTVTVSAAAIVLATLLALLGSLARLSDNPVANGAAGFYISLIRGTPLLVQIYIWYLALPQVGITLEPMLAGILALGVNYGAYMTEVFRAGIQAIGKGQREAAQALGMSSAQTFRRIVLPQAFRIVIPPIGNEFIAMMKDSALVSIITVHELTFRAQKIGRQNFRNLETFLIAAAFYWLLTIIFQFLQDKLETYMARGERR